uniref:Uncharacterized protein n=1 Tax=Avena sativa TaxID=4498 RepID=A0ACD5VCL0_AVESA
MEGMAAPEEDGGVVTRRRVAGVTIDLDVLDCPVCCHPLRPPVFQCTVGHIICSSCLEKLQDNGKCYLCSLRMVYSRCHMVEHIIESIKVACSNSNLGCTARMTYYQKEDHEKGCRHVPCFCPEDGCSFSGSTMMLLDHFSISHKWQSVKVTYNMRLAFCLQVGTSMVLVGDDGHLFLVQVVICSFDALLLVCCIQPHNTGSTFNCSLKLSRHQPRYSQATKFLMRSTNLRDGMPGESLRLMALKELFSNTGASAAAKVGMVLELVITPQ